MLAPLLDPEVEPGGTPSLVLPPLVLPLVVPPLVVPPPPLVLVVPPPLLDGEPSGLKSDVEPASAPAPGGGQFGLKSPKTLHV